MRGPIQVLIELARRRSDEAARALGAEIAAQNATRERRATLERYRDDYALRIGEVSRAGVAGGTLRDLHGFFERLGAAEVQQQRDDLVAEQRVLQARAAWHAAQRRLEGYNALEARARAQQDLRRRRVEQTQQDEMAARRSRERSIPERDRA